MKMHLSVMIATIALVTACIPGPDIAYNDPFDKSLQRVVKGSTQRSDVHRLLGEPLIRNDLWGVEVYRGSGKVAYTMITPPLFMRDVVPYYALLLYDTNNIVEAFTSDAEYVELNGFTLFGYNRRPLYLLAPKATDSPIIQAVESLENCILYVIPYGNEEIVIQGTYDSNNYPSPDSRFYLSRQNWLSAAFGQSYFRIPLSSGKYYILITTNMGKTTSHVLQCQPGKNVFVQVSRKSLRAHRADPDQSGYIVDTSDNAPKEIFKRQLVLYPTVPKNIRPYR